MASLLIVVVGVYLFTAFPEPNRESSPPNESMRPMYSSENSPPAAQVHPELLQEVADDTEVQRITREQQPFLHVLMESAKLVPGDFLRLGTRELDADLCDQIEKDPASHRGLPMSARGFFSFVRPRTVSLDIDGQGNAQDFPTGKG